MTRAEYLPPATEAPWCVDLNRYSTLMSAHQVRTLGCLCAEKLSAMTYNRSVGQRRTGSTTPGHAVEALFRRRRARVGSQETFQTRQKGLPAGSA